MHFAYDGFTQNGDRRCFLFRGIEEHNPTSIFCIEIDLRLLLDNRVLVQEAPMFCLQLLTVAHASGPSSLDKLLSYRVVGEDFTPLLMERERRAAEKAMKKNPYKRPIKPSSTSGLRLGTPSREH